MRIDRVWTTGTLFIAIVFALYCGGLEAQTGLSDLTNAQAGEGLKEALSRGISTAVSSTGKPGGYFDNAAIKILMPPKLQTVEKGLRTAGMGPQVDSFIRNMNSAAEEAAPAARSIFMEALMAMSVEDAKGIVTGGRTAGTEYFKNTTSAKLSEAFKPKVNRSMDKIGVTQQFQDLMSKAPSMPFIKTPTQDIDAYVLQKSIDGLFFVMGEEETRIRTNPMAQVTPLLKSVFGAR